MTQLKVKVKALHGLAESRKNEKRNSECGLSLHTGKLIFCRGKVIIQLNMKTMQTLSIFKIVLYHPCTYLAFVSYTQIHIFLFT